MYQPATTDQINEWRAKAAANQLTLEDMRAIVANLRADRMLAANTVSAKKEAAAIERAEKAAAREAKAAEKAAEREARAAKRASKSEPKSAENLLAELEGL